MVFTKTKYIWNLSWKNKKTTIKVNLKPSFNKLPSVLHSSKLLNLFACKYSQYYSYISNTVLNKSLNTLYIITDAFFWKFLFIISKSKIIYLSYKSLSEKKILQKPILNILYYL